MMRNPFLLLLALLMLYGSGVAAQQKAILTSRDSILIQQGLADFPGSYYLIADSLSKKGDSIQASEWFTKIDPCYLMWAFENPETPNQIMAGLKLKSETKRAYRQRYRQVREAEKSEAYNAFAQMHKEDQEVRWMLEKCDDSLTCTNLSKRMRKSDSMHFAYLYDYVQEHGWPGIKDGSLHACVIAIHDHSKHEYYIPHLVKAIQESQAPIQPLMLILHWMVAGKTGKELKAFLETATKVSFDVSSLLSNEQPASLPRIMTAVKKHCPVIIRYTFEAHDPKLLHEYFERSHYPHRHSHPATKLVVDLRSECPYKACEICNSISYLPATRSKPRLMMHILYGESIKNYQR